MDEKELINCNFDNLTNVCRFCLNYKEHLMTIFDESNNEYTNLFENSSIIQMTENMLNVKVYFFSILNFDKIYLFFHFFISLIR